MLVRRGKPYLTCVALLSAALLLITGCFSGLDASDVPADTTSDGPGPANDDTSGDEMTDDTPDGQGDVPADDDQSDGAGSDVSFIEGLCLGCHSPSSGDGPKGPIVIGTGSVAAHLHPDNGMDCVVCHELARHGRGVRLFLPDDPKTVLVVKSDPSGDPSAAEQLVPFCNACHPARDYAVHVTGTDWSPACTSCHDVHDPHNDNLARVADSVRNHTLGKDKPVVFTAHTGRGSFSDGTAAHDGICEVCHTATVYHRHDGGGALHYAGTDCTTCHTHAGGFIPPGGASCIGCHSVTRGARRAVVDEFGLASHHVQAAISDEDCVVCHEMSQHQRGEVRLRSVDDPDNAATVVSLSGDPLSSLIEAAKLEPFCLGCHDADGAAGSAPFADGLTPTPIDANRWAAASHHSPQSTCVGDGATFGCHSTGHGSVKRKLLAPWDGSQPGVPGDALRQEEGLCYSCHDADGPAATDVQSQFALTTHHDVSTLDQSEGSRVECTNCHNPHQANAATPLIDPDSGGVWTGSSEAHCLRCHDGLAPTGVAFPATSPGTGFDKSTFVGTTHDAQLGSRSCRHCHEAHGSAHLAMLRQRYVVEDYNEYTAGDGDYAACWQCHIEDTIMEGLDAFVNRHKDHVKREDVPCIACHDAHAGFDLDEPGLIDLDYAVGRGYDIEFIDGYDGSTSFWIEAATDRGNCYIKCHAESHTPEDYNRMDVPTTDCAPCHPAPLGAR